MKLRHLFSALCLCFVSITAFGQGNGKLQLHFMDVGQGDRIYAPSGRQGIASAGVVSTRPATILAPSSVCEKRLAVITDSHS